MKICPSGNCTGMQSPEQCRFACEGNVLPNSSTELNQHDSHVPLQYTNYIQLRDSGISIEFQMLLDSVRPIGIEVFKHQSLLPTLF